MLKLYRLAFWLRLHRLADFAERRIMRRRLYRATNYTR
jgi:hypothetical protein